MKPIQSSFLFALLFLGNLQAQTLKHNPKLEIFFETIVFENGDQYVGQTMFGKPHGIGTIISNKGSMVTGYFNEGEWVAKYVVNTPWHMVDIFYSFKEPLDFNTFSIDLDIKSDIPQGINLGISPFGGSSINHKHFYGALQTSGGGFKSANHLKDSSEYHLIKRSMIFTRWAEPEGEAIKIAQDGFCESGVYEGDFVSVRNRIDWTKGKYTFTLRKTSDQVKIYGETHTFVEMSVYEHATQQTYVCGSLAFPGSALFLSADHTIFFELYDQYISMDKIPVVKFEVNNIKVNGTPVPLHVAGNSMSVNCPRFAKVSYQEKGGFSVEIGLPHVEADQFIFDGNFYQVFLDKREK